MNTAGISRRLGRLILVFGGWALFFQIIIWFVPVLLMYANGGWNAIRQVVIFFVKFYFALFGGAVLLSFYGERTWRLRLSEGRWPRIRGPLPASFEKFTDKSWRNLPPYEEAAVIPWGTLPYPQHSTDEHVAKYPEPIRRLWAILYVVQHRDE